MKGFFFLMFLNSLFLMCISFPTNTLSMSDEVIKFVIIEKQQSCDSAVSPGSLAHRRKAWGSPAGMKKKKDRERGPRQKMVCECSLHPSPLLYPKIYPFFFFFLIQPEDG